MKPAPFDYARPATTAEALELLALPGAKVLAGGQSLVPLLSMRLASVGLLVDINRIPGLDRIECDASGVRVGALVRHSDLLADDEAVRVQPLLSAALSRVAHPTIRNRGTTVGSVAHADPAGEMPAVLSLLGGHVVAASTSGTREVPATELFAGPMETTLAAGELAVSAYFPGLTAGEGVAIDEVARRHGDYALCGVAALVGTESGRVTSARVSYFSVCEVPTVVDLSGVFAAGEVTDRALVDAADLALTRLDPVADIHATADYRAQLTRTLTVRVVRAAHRDAVVR